MSVKQRLFDYINNNDCNALPFLRLEERDPQSFYSYDECDIKLSFDAPSSARYYFHCRQTIPLFFVNVVDNVTTYKPDIDHIYNQLVDVLFELIIVAVLNCRLSKNEAFNNHKKNIKECYPSDDYLQFLILTEEEEMFLRKKNLKNKVLFELVLKYLSTIEERLQIYNDTFYKNFQFDHKIVNILDNIDNFISEYIKNFN